MIFTIAISLLAGVISLALLYHHHLGDSGGGLIDMVCGGGENSGCDVVNAGGYSSFVGIPLAAAGAYGYFGLALLFGYLMFQGPEIRQFGVRLGLVIVSVALAVDLLYLGIQYLVIDRFCALCLVTYLLTGILFLLIFPKRKGAAGGGFLSIYQTREGKSFLFSITSTAVMLGVAVFMTNAALGNSDPRTMERRLTDQVLAEFEASTLVSPATDGAPFLGSAEAPLQIVIFSDFLCPWCGTAAKFFEQHMPRWKDRVRVTFMNYPLDQLCNPYQRPSLHAGSCWSALGGLCAREQGKFWEFHDRIFREPPKDPTGADIMKVGYQVGIDTNVMKNCMTSTAMRKQVQTQIEEAHRLGVTGTPKIFINGRLLPKLASLTAVLRTEAERLGIAPLENLDD